MSMTVELLVNRTTWQLLSLMHRSILVLNLLSGFVVLAGEEGTGAVCKY